MLFLQKRRARILKKQKNLYNAALYCRLSRDDENSSESESILNQKQILSDFAKENKFNIVDYYVDDGYSGTNFDRPAFKRMIKDIENGTVNVVITKDLSRLGRNYILTGQYTEIYFPSKGVRYIAINDGFDSNNSDNDIAPFKNIINEMVAKDTSKKVKSVFQAKMKKGEYIGSYAPYGYKKDPENKNRFIIDEPAAEIVKRMFYLATIGYGSRKIAKTFNEEGILPPAVYRCLHLTHTPVEKFTKTSRWSDQAVNDMLHNMAYLGHMVQGKSKKTSFKVKKLEMQPKEEWIIVYNTHEAIIDKELFDEVQYRLKSKYREKRIGINLFAGITKCADCGYAMTYSPRHKKGLASLFCSNYRRRGKEGCTNHMINYDLLCEIVIEEIRKYAQLAIEDEEAILKKLKDKTKDTDKIGKIALEEELTKAEKRYREIDDLIQHLYEDNVRGKITDERFTKLSVNYENEQKEVKERITNLKFDIVNFKDTSKNNERFIELIKKYSNITELNPVIMHELIDRIEIGQGYYEKSEATGKREKHQDITIYYKFIGNLEQK